MPKHPLQSARRAVMRLLGAQVAITLTSVGIFFMVNTELSARSALLGGSLGIVPNICYAWLVFRPRRLTQPGSIIWVFYFGEFIKLALTAILFIVIIKLLTINMFPFILTFAATFLAFWLMPLLLCERLS